ncbi:uncharacterized protein FIESC28_11448 [Fusarium coffeatum]|uniref:Transcription factor domain-containing protein n=1 Tax=Fusarium coffeatum TaxID=231269 RepID=A0A366QM85_9HYPO|nr:uncharacterized protein FIESC28_11448 [Fusarium coffeatum]RBR04980.1 hypothetical protein FIESC28_11448 [Fusarium coffeatum]
MTEPVVLSSPGQSPTRRRQGKVTQQVAYYGSQMKTSDCDTNSDQESFNAVSRIYTPWTSDPYANIAGHTVDPFDTLCENPDRLRQLLRHPSARYAGEPLFRIDESNNSVLFQSLNHLSSFLTDKTLFHALSLVLALEANNHVPNYETLYHRGKVLESLNLNLGDAPSLQCITAILMLISYEYRVRDMRPAAATHIRGLQTLLHQFDVLASGYNPAGIQKTQRALFWQDIMCSLATGTPRLLQFDVNDAFARLREDSSHRKYFVLPEGFKIHIDGWPATSVRVLADLNALCCVVDAVHRQKRLPGRSADLDGNDTTVSIPLMEDLDDEGYPLSNAQANLQIRLVDLLSETRTSPQKEQTLIYRACLFAAYLCTYRLSSGIWEGYFAPEKCVAEILNCMENFTKHMSPWKLAPDISFWLLLVAGGLTKSQVNRNRAALLVQRYRCFYPSDYGQDWEIVEGKLKEFIWCEHAMKKKCYAFWQECHDVQH